MQDENESKINNGREILQHIKDMKNMYEAQPVDIVEEEMSFLDKMNKLVQLILNDSSFSIYTALQKDSLDKWKQKRISRWFKGLILNNWKNAFYFIFLVCITVFLVSEAVTFYADGQAIDFKTYTKAILTEISFIFLSGYGASNLKERIWVNILRAGVFSLMLFVISSQTLINGVSFDTNSQAVQEQIQILEKQIEAKEKDIQFYVGKEWGNNARKQMEEKSMMVSKLLELKEKQAQGSNKDVSRLVVYKSYGQAFFRVILLLISVLITKRLFVF